MGLSRTVRRTLGGLLYRQGGAESKSAGQPARAGSSRPLPASAAGRFARVGGGQTFRGVAHLLLGPPRTSSLVPFGARCPGPATPASGTNVRGADQVLALQGLDVEVEVPGRK